GTSGSSAVAITVGLVLLGLGWSTSVIAGASLLSTSVDPQDRPRLQGRNDLVMNLSGAGGGLLAGLVVAWQGYGTLNALAATLTLPVLALVLSGRRAARELAATPSVRRGSGASG
ncbi:MAG: MFS transporter, partial [Aeromicrobium erythreum]